MHFTCIDNRLLRSFIGKPFPTPHAFWWLVRCFNVGVLFIGDMNVHDVDTARTFIDEIFKRGISLHGVLLPSFGGVTTHGAKKPLELKNLIGGFAQKMHAQGILLGALPHLVNAGWADYNALRI